MIAATVRVVLTGVFLAQIFLVQNVSARELVVTVDGIWVEKGGTVYISVHANEAGFESNSDPALSASFPVDTERLQTVFDTAGFDEVAVAVFHDFNGNGDMDSNIIGLPREGFGASTNPESTTSARNGAPRFIDARFDPSLVKTVTIPVRYLFRQESARRKIDGLIKLDRAALSH